MSASARWQARLAAAVARPAAPLPGQWGPRVSSARLAIHRNNALAPLLQSLQETLPACGRLTGAPRWRALLLEFVRAHPPASPVLHDYGEQLPDWLARRGEPAVLCALARLELEVVRCWHAEERPLLTPAVLADLQAGQQALAELHLQRHPAAALLDSPWPIGSLWLAAHGVLPAPPGAWPRHDGDDAPAVEPAAETVLVARQDWQVEVRLLEAPAAALLRALVGGQTLAEAVAAGMACGESDPARLLSALVGCRAFIAPVVGNTV